LHDLRELTGKQWGKDKTPSHHQQFDPNQQYSPQSAQTPGYPGTPNNYFNQYGGKYSGQAG
jgi:nucleolysin TIA-1/TIAR